MVELLAAGGSQLDDDFAPFGKAHSRMSAVGGGGRRPDNVNNVGAFLDHISVH